MVFRSTPQPEKLPALEDVHASFVPLTMTWEAQELRQQPHQPHQSHGVD